MVADTQFSTLGVVLTAILARVGGILGLPSKGKQQGLGIDINLKSLLSSSVPSTGQDAGEIVLRQYVEDVGKVVGRRNDEEELSPTDGLGQTVQEVKEPVTDTKADQASDSEVGRDVQMVNMLKRTTAEQEVDSVKSQVRPSKRRKKGNAIDDLFSGLVLLEQSLKS